MHARPTTEQILNDLAREVRDELIPRESDPANVPILQMMEQLLTATAVRAGHEIAWMNEEIDAAIPFVRDVVAATGNASATEALAAYDDGRSDSLHLDDQVENYSLASEALGVAIEACADDADLSARGADLIRSRRDAETEIRPGFFFPGQVTHRTRICEPFCAGAKRFTDPSRRGSPPLAGRQDRVDDGCRRRGRR